MLFLPATSETICWDSCEYEIRWRAQLFKADIVIWWVDWGQSIYTAVKYWWGSEGMYSLCRILYLCLCWSSVCKRVLIVVTLYFSARSSVKLDKNVEGWMLMKKMMGNPRRRSAWVFQLLSGFQFIMRDHLWSKGIIFSFLGDQKTLQNINNSSSHFHSPNFHLMVFLIICSTLGACNTLISSIWFTKKKKENEIVMHICLSGWVFFVSL